MLNTAQGKAGTLHDYNQKKDTQHSQLNFTDLAAITGLTHGNLSINL